MVFVIISWNRILYPEVVDLVKEVFLAILIQAMKSIGESGMTNQHRTVINGLLQKKLPIDTFEQDLKVAPIWVRKTIWNIAKEIEQWQNGWTIWTAEHQFDHKCSTLVWLLTKLHQQQSQDREHTNPQCHQGGASMQSAEWRTANSMFPRSSRDRRASPLRPYQRLKHALTFRFCRHPWWRAFRR